MQKISSLIKKLSLDFPTLTFALGERFSWNPSETTVSYIDSAKDSPLLLHEVSHALLNHTAYHRDIELLRLERDAWERAKHLANDYSVTISENYIEDHLNSYRAWLHERSTCPECSASGIQTKQDTYMCPACSSSWRVNEARSCQLKRYSLTRSS